MLQMVKSHHCAQKRMMTNEKCHAVPCRIRPAERMGIDGVGAFSPLAPHTKTSHRFPGAQPDERKDCLRAQESKAAPPYPASRALPQRLQNESLFQWHSLRAGDCECARKGVSGTNGVHGDDLRRSDIQDSARGDNERGIATTGDDHLLATGDGACTLRLGGMR